MVDVEKILGLTPDERKVLSDLATLYREAEKVVNLITNTWKFKIGENEIDMRPFTPAVGCKNRLTHDGQWIITFDTEEVVNITQDEIYKLFEARYLVDHELFPEDKEAYNELHDEEELCGFFQHFLDATEKKAGIN